MIFVQPRPAKYFWNVGRFVGIFPFFKRQYSTIPTNYHIKIYPFGDAKEIQGLTRNRKSFFRMWGISAPHSAPQISKSLINLCEAG